jgi:hypothetical protein
MQSQGGFGDPAIAVVWGIDTSIRGFCIRRSDCLEGPLPKIVRAVNGASGADWKLGDQVVFYHWIENPDRFTIVCGEPLSAKEEIGTAAQCGHAVPGGFSWDFGWRGGADALDAKGVIGKLPLLSQPRSDEARWLG